MTIPLDITDPKLVRAYAHPLRIRILGLLDNRTASPSEIATELGTPLSNTSYHVRQLVALGLVELVGRTARRGAIEHHYTARVRPTITDAGWAKLPDIVKRAVVEGWLQQTIAHVVNAAQAGGFHRDDAHHSRTAGRVDDEGWSELSRELALMLERAERIVEESEARLDRDPGKRAVDVTTVLMQFERPEEQPISSPAKPGARTRSRGPELQLDDAPPR